MIWDTPSRSILNILQSATKSQSAGDRYDLFHKAIKKKYPQIKIINLPDRSHKAVNLNALEQRKKNALTLLTSITHPCLEMDLANCHRYDNMPSDGPKVFLGEYASWGNTYYNALIEAAYMTGLENNAHAIGLVCYAPYSKCRLHKLAARYDLFDNHRVIRQ